MNFFKNFLKTKKVIVIALIFCFIAGVVTPLTVNAQGVGAIGGAAGCGLGARLGMVGGSAITPGLGTLLGGIVGCVGGAAVGYFKGTDIATGLLKAVVYGISLLIYYTSIAIVQLMAGLLHQLITGQLINVSYTGADNFIVTDGWSRMRDFANMIIVLGFVIVGIATALRWKEYAAKQLLPKLIIVALLINFSLMICGIIIDGSNILTENFLTPSSYLTDQFYLHAESQSGAMGKLYNEDSDTTKFVLVAAGMTFYNIAICLSFILTFTLLLFRYFALWILVILSPLAFVFSIFPFSKKFFQMWLDQLTKWALIGAINAFFMFSAAKLLRAALGPNVTAAQTADSGVFFLPAMFLIIGYFATMKMAPMGATFAIGLVRSAAGFAMGAAVGAGGVLKELSSRTPLGRRTQEAFSGARARVAESLGFAQVGNAAQEKRERAAAAEKQVESLRTSSAPGDRNRYERLAASGRGSMGAAAVHIANQKGDLDRITGNNLDQKNRLVTQATQFGYERNTFDEKDYRMAALNKPKVDAALKAQGITDPTKASYDQRKAAEDRVKKTQLITNLPKMSGAELGKIDPDDIQDYDMFKENFTPNMIRQLDTAPTELKSSILAHRSKLFDEADQALKDGNQSKFNKLRDLHNAVNRFAPTPHP